MVRTWARRASVSVALACCALLGAEGTVRIDEYFRYGVGLLAAPDHDRDLMIRDSLGLRGRPGGRYRHWRLNEYGFRGPSMPRLPGPGCRRVMVLGASETFGYYEGEGREYPRQLADSLRARGECGEVVNAAVAGFTVPYMIRLWEDWARRFEPNTVLVYPNPAFYLAANQPRYPEAAGPPITPDHRWWRPRIVGRLKERFEVPAPIQEARVRRGVERQIAAHSEDWVFSGLPQERLEAFERDMDSLTRAVQNAGARVVLVIPAMRFGDTLTREDVRYLASWRQFFPRAPDSVLVGFYRAGGEAVCRVARARGSEVVDAARVMSGNRELFADATHFTELGAGVLGGLLARSVAAAAGGGENGPLCGPPLVS